MGINLGAIAVFGRNNDPNQSIVFAGTGDPEALGVQPKVPATGAHSRGDSAVADGAGHRLPPLDRRRARPGSLLDSSVNFDSAGKLSCRSTRRCATTCSSNTAAFKVVVDPKPTPTGDVIVYAALSDVDATGHGDRPATARAGGIWRSVDSGKNWTRMSKAGQATDVVLDLASGTGAPDGNLQILYAAIKRLRRLSQPQPRPGIRPDGSGRRATR